MVYTKYRLLLVILLIIGVDGAVKAQHEAIYAHYMYNQQTINPAYSGLHEGVEFMVVYRNQWIGVDGAPETLTASVQIPVREYDYAIGLSVTDDKIGRESRLTVMGDYAYSVDLAPDGLKLRMGVKFGFSNYNHNLAEYKLIDSDDMMFQGYIDDKHKFNFGIGLFLHDKRYFVGISSPRILNTTYDNVAGTGEPVVAKFRHIFGVAGYVWNLSDGIEFKPTVCVKYVDNVPLQMDLTVTSFFKNSFSLGAFYRTGDSVGFMTGYEPVKSKIRIGYSYEYGLIDLNGNLGTHDVMFSYIFGTNKKKFTSPRYF